MHTKNDQVTRGSRRRREHSPELKRELVARSLLPDASVSAIALEAGINANLLFTWRRAYRNTAAGAPSSVPTSSAVLLPVTVDVSQREVLIAPPLPAPRPVDGTIEIDVGGARVRLRGLVEDATVRCVLQTLRSAA